MNLPDARSIDPAISATWPAERTWRVGSITMRTGGGQRATAATVDGLPEATDLDRAEADMIDLRGESLFRVRDWERPLARDLDTRGYAKRDETNILAMAIADLADRPLKPVSAFAVWPPLAIMEELWNENDIGPVRQENMTRVEGPKTGLLGRGSDQPGGVGFVAVHNDIAMIHAVAVQTHLRRQKIAENMMIAAAQWAQDVGAKWLTTLCTCHNSAANSLYTSLGMTVVARYHYRAKKTA